MDDWSKVPSRQAVSEPAPNHQGTLTNPSNDRQTQPAESSADTGADQPCRQQQALDPPGLARQRHNQAGAEPRNPFYDRTIPMTTHTTPQANVKNGRTRLDIHRPFMDDRPTPDK